MKLKSTANNKVHRGNSNAKKKNVSPANRSHTKGAKASPQAPAEETLQHPDLLWRSIFSAANDAIMILDDKYNIIVANQKAGQMYGLTEQELTGMGLRDLRADALKDLAQVQMKDAIRRGGLLWETIHQRKDGTRFPVEVSTKSFEIGGRRKFVHIVRDITQRKRAEQELRERETLLRLILDTSPAVIFVKDRDSTILEANQRMAVFYNMSVTDVIGRRQSDLHRNLGARQQDVVKWLADDREVIDTGKTKHMIESGVDINNQMHWFETTKYPIDIGWDRTGVLVFSEDITRRKQAEEKIFFQAKLLDAVSNAVIATDPQGRVMYWNPAAEKLYGWTAAEALGRNIVDLTPTEQSREQAMEIMEDLMRGRSWSGEFLVRRKDGSIFPAFVSDSPIVDHSGNLAAIIGVSEDITERKKAEEALQASESRYRLAIEHSSIILAQCDLDLRYTWIVNPHPDFDPVDIIGRRDVELADNKGSRQLMQMKQRVIDTGKGLRLDIDFSLSDGSRTYDVLAEPLRDAAGAVIGVTTSALDITGRKQTEKALKDVYQKLDLILNTSPLPILGADAEGRITSWNRAAEKMFGWTEQETIGKVCPTVPDEFIQDYLEMIQRAIRHVPTFGLVRYRQKRSGTRLLCSISATPQASVHGKVTGVTLILEDITERVKDEENLKEAHTQLRNLTTRLNEVEENERRSLARELHDRVGQTLSALNINLNIMREQISGESARRVGSRIEDSIHLVDEAVTNMRNVMADLHPPVLDEYGLAAALRWYADRFSKRTEVPVRVQEAWETGTRLSLRLETVLFRIAQEALTNVALHAEAGQVIIRLESHGQTIRMKVEDDGRGFDSDAVMGSDLHSGWGLRTMRERIEAVGGGFHLESTPGHGTRIIAEIDPGIEDAE